MSTRPGTHDVALNDLRRDGGTQARAQLDDATISEYAAAYKAGEQLPPVVAFKDEAGMRWLADGFHRVHGAHRAGKETIPCCTYKGTQRDAILHAAGANAQHGLRRTNADKRRAVEMLVRDREWSKWSDRKIAETAGVHHETVAAVRAELAISPIERASKQKDSVRHAAQGEPASGRVTPLETAAEDDEGSAAAVDAAALPGESPIEMHGIEADATWIEGVALTIAGLTALDGKLRALVGQAGALTATAAVQQAAREAIRQAGDRVRALVPVMACVYCRDPDGEFLRAHLCSACGGEGTLTAEQSQRVPAELLLPGAAPVVKATAKACSDCGGSKCGPACRYKRPAA